MKKYPDVETRGRPRNSDFTDFCELLAADFPREEMKVAKHGDVFTVYGRLLDGGKQDYLNFRNSVSLNALKKDMKRDGFKTSVYFQDGLVYLKARKA
jgi:hypothetical protein